MTLKASKDVHQESCGRRLPPCGPLAVCRSASSVGSAASTTEQSWRTSHDRLPASRVLPPVSLCSSCLSLIPQQLKSGLPEQAIPFSLNP